MDDTGLSVVRRAPRDFQGDTDPGTLATAGDRWSDTATNTLKVFFDNAWVPLARSHDDGGGAVFDVRAFGCVDDGLADCVAPVRAMWPSVEALAANGSAVTVLFPQGGIYQMDNPSYQAAICLSPDNAQTRGRIVIRIEGTVRLSANTPRFLDFCKQADYDWFRNLTIWGPGTLDAGNTTASRHHVLLGTLQATGIQDSLNIERIHVGGKLRITNVHTDPTGVNARWVVGIGPRSKPGDATRMYIRHILIEDVRIEGGDLGFMVTSGLANATADAAVTNYYMYDIIFRRLHHDTLVTPTAFWTSGSFFIGGFAAVEDCLLADSYSNGTGDCSIEIDNCDNAVIDNVRCRNSWNQPFLSNNFRAPPRGVDSQRYIYRDCRAECYSTNIVQPGAWVVTSSVGVGFGTLELRGCSVVTTVLCQTGSNDCLSLLANPANLAGLDVGETVLRVEDLAGLGWVGGDAVSVGTPTATTITVTPVSRVLGDYTVTLAGALAVAAPAGTVVSNTTRGTGGVITDSSVAAGQTVVHVAGAALAAWQAGDSVTVAPPTVTTLVGAPLANGTLAITLATGVLAALAVGTVVSNTTRSNSAVTVGATVAAGGTAVTVSYPSVLGWASGDTVVLGGLTTTISGAPVLTADGTYTVVLAAGLGTPAADLTTVTNTTRANSKRTTGLAIGAKRLLMSSTVGWNRMYAGKDAQIGSAVNGEWLTVAASADQYHLRFSSGTSMLHNTGVLISMPMPMQRIIIDRFQHISTGWTANNPATINYQPFAINVQDCQVLMRGVRSVVRGTVAGTGGVICSPIALSGRRVTFDLDDIDLGCSETITGGATGATFYGVNLGPVNSTRPSGLRGRIRRLRMHDHLGFTTSALAGVFVSNAANLAPTGPIVVEACDFGEIAGASLDVRLQVSTENAGSVFFGPGTIWSDPTVSVPRNAAVAITPTGSPFIYQDTTAWPHDVLVQGGTVSAMEVKTDLSNFYPLGITSGRVRLAPGDSLRVTYSVAPTINRFAVRY